MRTLLTRALSSLTSALLISRAKVLVPGFLLSLRMDKDKVVDLDVSFSS